MTKSFAVAPLALMQQSALPSNQAQNPQYAKVLRRLLGDACVDKTVKGTMQQVLSRTELLQGNPEVTRRIAFAVENAARNTDWTVLDLRTPPEISDTPLPPRAFQCIGTALLGWAESSFSSSKLLLVTEELPNTSEFEYRGIAPLVEAKKLVLVSQDGHIRGHSEVLQLPFENVGVSEWLVEEVASDLRLSVPSLVSLVREKTIRRLGYFPRPKADEVNRYFFDGSLCGEELRAIIGAFLLAVSDGGIVPLVIYDLSVSRWLRVPLTGACVDTAVRRSFSAVELPSVPRNNSRKAPVVVVVPLVQTRSSLTETLKTARRKFPKSSIHVLAVYSIHGIAGDNSLGSFDLEVETDMGNGTTFSETIKVSFVHRVQQSTVKQIGLLPEVRYYAQKVDFFEQERFVSLSSDDFWTMALEFDFVEERNVPKRPGLARVPDLVSILKRNGPWIASKLAVAALQLADVDIRKVTLVSVGGEVGAAQLSRSLQLMFGNEPIGVPRSILEEWDASGRSENLVNSWKDANESWATALVGAPSREAVILDEFAVTGGSLDSLGELVRAFGMSLTFMGALATFRRTRTRETLGPLAYFLYESELMEHYVA